MAHYGPIRLHVSKDYSFTELKTRLEKDYSIPVQYQHWIFGRHLLDNEEQFRLIKDKTVKEKGLNAFLYISRGKAT